MLTDWAALGIPPDNIVAQQYALARCMRVILQDPPQIPTRIQLPASTLAVKLWTSQSLVYYALDQVISMTPPVLLNPVPATTATPGDILFPNQEQLYALPDLNAHDLYLISAEPSVTVAVILLEE